MTPIPELRRETDVNIYRSVPEARLIDMLMLAGFAFELEAGQAEAARRITEAALADWVALGLGFRKGPDGTRLFDPVEVVNGLKALGLKGEDIFWKERYVTTGRRLVQSLEGGPSQFTVDFQRHINLRGLTAKLPLRLRLPLPLTGPYLSDLKVVPNVPPQLAEEVTLSDGRLDVRLKTPADDISLGASLSFTAHAFEAGLTPEILDAQARDLYLRPHEGLIRVTPKVTELAARLSAKTAEDTLNHFWSYMLDELKSGMIHYDQIPTEAPCDFVLEQGWYDCQIGSALFIALCRAQGIPARLVGGHVLYPRAPTNHYWAEVWLEGRGWLPFDLLSWDLSAGGADPIWRNRFFATLDQRMTTQVFPLRYTGPSAVRLPALWQSLQARKGEGIAVEFTATETGNLIFRDEIIVKINSLR